MKKVILLLAFSILSNLCNAQFKLKEGGLYSTGENEGFYVYEFPGVSQQNLYKKAKTALVGMYNSAKDVLSYEENEIISIKGISTSNVYFTFWGMTQPVRVDYVIKLMFKDGRMRINAPSVDLSTGSGAKTAHLYLKRGGAGDITGTSSCAYKKDGELRCKELDKTLPKYFNDICLSLISNMQNEESPNDNW